MRIKYNLPMLFTAAYVMKNDPTVQREEEKNEMDSSSTKDPLSRMMPNTQNPRPRTKTNKEKVDTKDNYLKQHASRP